MHDNSYIIMIITEELQMMDPPRSEYACLAETYKIPTESTDQGKYINSLMIQNIDYLSSHEMIKILILTTLLHKETYSCSCPT